MNRRVRGAAVLRDPLFHFALAGAAVFALFGNATSPEERRIVIDGPRVERLAGQFAQSFRRLPSAAELDALIREDLREEVYYREALRLGLDRDDAVVRRRMRLKMEAFAASPEDIAEPDDATLRRWLNAHRTRFAGEPRVSFEQKFVGTDPAAARAMLARLPAGEDVDGGPIALPARFQALSASEVDGLFGKDFARTIARLPIGTWSGPVSSSFGDHVVRVGARTAGRPPPLRTIHQRVENDWRAAQARLRTEAAYRDLLAGYDVVIDAP